MTRIMTRKNCRLFTQFPLKFQIAICSLHSSEEESRKGHAKKQFDKMIKQKKYELGKMLTSKIVIPSTIESLKFPVNEEGKIPTQRTSFEFVKNFVNEQRDTKSKKIKLFRTKK